MPFSITLNEEEWSSLVSLSREGVKDRDGNVIQDKALQLEAWIRRIEKKNSVTRSSLWIQWQEAGTQLPPTTRFPEVWPPEMRFYLELVTRPIAKVDVEEVLRVKARSPVNVLVTEDPGATVGWTELDAYFIR